MQLFDVRATRILLTITAFVAAGAFLYGIRHTIIIFLFTIFFAYLLAPLVGWVQASRLARGSRVLAIAETYICIALLFGVLWLVFGPRLARDAHRMTESLPGLLDNVASGNIAWQVGSRHGWSFETQRRIQHFIADHQQELVNWMTQAGARVAAFLADALWLILIPILAIFFLREGQQFAQALVHAFDRREQRRLLRDILQDMDRMLARFIFSQLLLGGFSLVAYGVVLTLLHFPYSLVLALAGGVMEFVPVVGPLMAAGAILSVGFLTGFPHLWIVVLFLGVWRISQDYIVSPRVMGRGLEMHPLVAIAAVMMGGELGGVIGVYLAIPIAATIRVLWSCWKAYSSAPVAAGNAKLAQVTSSPAPKRAPVRGRHAEL